MKFKKGSKEAKAYMAKLRAARGKKTAAKKVGATKKTTGIRAKKQYNKDVDAYKYFVVNNGKVEAGFEYKSDANDMAEDFYPKAKVLNKTQLKQQGIENPSSSWKYKLSGKDEQVYIDFLNKDKNFKKDRKYFDSYEDALKWMRNNFSKSSPDMIKYVNGTHGLNHYVIIQHSEPKNNKFIVEVLPISKYIHFEKGIYKNTILLDVVKTKAKANKDAKIWERSLNDAHFGKLDLTKKEMRLGMPPKTKSKASKSYHKDTKSHNVNIKVVSGLDSIDTLHKEIKQTQDLIIRYEKAIEFSNKNLKTSPSTYEKNRIKKNIAFFKSKLAYYKKALIQLKKMYNKK